MGKIIKIISGVIIVRILYFIKKNKNKKGQ